MSLNAVTWNEGDWALFLDVDGTLLEIAETPRGVRVPETINTLLIRASMHLDGALALVSGRALADIDSLFAPLKLCAAGVHGSERRDAFGCVSHARVDRARLEDVLEELELLVLKHPGLLLEDKGRAVAVHFRRAPHLSADVRAAMTRVRERWLPEFVLQPGKCVFEIRPARWSKGTAIREFMREAPFRARTPIYVGDDLTDEEGFAAVNELGGVSIRVGEPSASLARHRLRGVSDVIRWLGAIPAMAGS